ncbi:hypothetical protein [Methylocella sp. CPCC 101449]|uniref:hypothetical protein n=1 Tax=Methylocella sp. CPCC 101449 TaxID=2987531 RepID=UPI00288E65B1|nr:hypothetical protein [Methylocella sp. CPCC 101449]MDT2024537.1 hypothetical protein [Methylocella sp. CPCC 101449]
MTIAACYVSPEGLVLGADSTATYFTPSGEAHFYNHAQKLFQIGEGPTSLAAVTWGMGGLEVSSYRRMFARLGDAFKTAPPADVKDAADRWVQMFWAEYQAAPDYIYYQGLAAKTAYQAGDPNDRSELEERQFKNLGHNLVVGFCLGGQTEPDRSPTAFVMLFDPAAPCPVPFQMASGYFNFWGAPNVVQRLFLGWDDGISGDVLNSPHWTGNQQDLADIIDKHRLLPPTALIPIRDAVDFVHFGIFSTIKALKFSNFSQTCGGPIEIAVITADRPFRWVRHKEWNSAIIDGAP